MNILKETARPSLPNREWGPVGHFDDAVAFIPRGPSARFCVRHHSDLGRFENSSIAETNSIRHDQQRALLCAMRHDPPARIAQVSA
jgi:hypothetical protein